MTEEVGVVRRIVWREILPWLIIFRAFRISISLPVLFLATIGWVLTPVGSQIGSSLFLSSEPELAAEVLQPVRTLAVVGGWSQAVPSFESLDSSPIAFVYQHFARPFVHLFDRTNSLSESAFHLFSGLWSIAIWAMFAGAITRIATVQLGRDERVDLRSAITYSARQYGWSFVAPLFPLLGVLLASLPLVLLGLVMRADLGMIVAGILWPLALLGGLVMTILLLGLFAGWPLMWPTISSEEHGDAFEAFSRSFSYVFQRPLQYIFYLVLSAVIGTLGWMVISQASEAGIQLTYYATSWGASNERVDHLAFGEFTGGLGIGVGIVRFFDGAVRTIAMAFNFSFFFCMLTAIYLVLRRDVDKTDFDEIYVEEKTANYSLPPLKSNEPDPPTPEDASPIAGSTEQGKSEGNTDSTANAE